MKHRILFAVLGMLFIVVIIRAAGAVHGVSVEQFGAKGDGVTDDRAAFQAAYDALPTPQGGIILLRCGANYKIDAGLSWSTKFVHLKGCGSGFQPNTGTRITAAAGITAITLGGGTGGLGQKPHLEGFRLIGSDTVADINDGIVIQANSTIVRDVVVQSFGQFGIHIASGDGSVPFNACGSRLDQVHLNGNLTGGLKVDGLCSNALVFTNLVLTSNTGFGMHIFQGSHNSAYGILLEGNTTGGIKLEASVSNRFFGVYYENQNAPALQMDAGSARNVVDFTTAARPDGLSPIEDSGSYNYFRVDGGGALWSSVVVGRHIGTPLDNVSIQPGLLTMEAGAQLKFQDNPLTANWFIQAVAGDLVVSSAQDKFLNVGRGKFAGVTFANLGTPANGSFIFCADCAIANPCAAGGTGAFAKRLGDVWVCN